MAINCILSRHLRKAMRASVTRNCWQRRQCESPNAISHHIYYNGLTVTVLMGTVIFPDRRVIFVCSLFFLLRVRRWQCCRLLAPLPQTNVTRIDQRVSLHGLVKRTFYTSSSKKNLYDVAKNVVNQSPEVCPWLLLHNVNNSAITAISFWPQHKLNVVNSNEMQGVTIAKQKPVSPRCPRS